MKIKIYLVIIVTILLVTNLRAQVDSLKNRTIYAWKLNPYDLSPELTNIDTSLAEFQNYNPLLAKTITANYLGNLGTAAQSRIYYDRQNFNTGFLFSQPYGIYFHLPKDQVYYNTKKQFTLLKFSNAGPKNESEQVLKALHTQNVNEKLNFGIDYDLIASDGRFFNQQVRQNRITLFSSYQGNKYNLHTHYDLNRVKAQENGGIDSLQYISADEYSNRQNIPVRLEKASNQVLNTGFYLIQEYRFKKSKEEPEKETELNNKKDEKFILVNNKGKNKEISEHNKDIQLIDSLDQEQKDTIQHRLNDRFINQKVMSEINKFEVSGFSISHELIYNSDIRRFSDKDLESSFYDNKVFYIDSTKTSDYVRQRQLGNKLSLNFKFKNKFSSSLSYYNELMKYQYNIAPDSIFINNDTIINTDLEKNYSNNNVSMYLKALLFDQIYFSGYGEYYFNGYKNESSFIDLKFAYILLKNTEISFEGKYKNQKPDYFYRSYSSNNFKWENDHLRMIEEWQAGFAVRNKKHNVEANIRYGQISNYIYNNTTANLTQHFGQINILSAELFKWLKLGPFNSVTRFVYQKSTNDSILSLPEFNLYQSLYFEHLSTYSTGGELLWQIGLNYRYSSIYWADGYMPTSGLFYRQFNIAQPEYHSFDAFINLAIKRAKIYFKYNYLNVIIDKNYQFNAPFYPAPDPVFKFGVAWTFYD